MTAITENIAARRTRGIASCSIYFVAADECHLRRGIFVDDLHADVAGAHTTALSSLCAVFLTAVHRERRRAFVRDGPIDGETVDGRPAVVKPRTDGDDLRGAGDIVKRM